MSNIELIIARTLRFGLLFAIFIELIGGLGYFIQAGHDKIYFTEFHEPTRSLIEIGRNLSVFSFSGLILIGFLILMMTQMIRVSLTAWLFFHKKDKVFTGISLFILAILLYSIIGC